MSPVNFYCLAIFLLILFIILLLLFQSPFNTFLPLLAFPPLLWATGAIFVTITAVTF